MAELRVKGTGTIKLFENDNTSSVTIASPASLAADRTITLPDASVTLASGTMLATDGSGASLTALNASELGSGTVPAARLSGVGTVLQVIRASTATITTTSSISMVDITDLTVNITPSATSSKVFVIMNVNGMSSEGSATSGVSLRIYQASDISGEVMNIGFGTTIQLNQCATLTALESPSSTSELTYKGQCRNREAVNVRVNNSSDTSSITVMEIAG